MRPVSRQDILAGRIKMPGTRLECGTPAFLASRGGKRGPREDSSRRRDVVERGEERLLDLRVWPVSVETVGRRDAP